MFSVNLRLFCREALLTPGHAFSSMMVIAESVLASLAGELPPPLADDRYKGQAGRIGIIGGSLEYTGAPYFAGISALRVGADLVHVFCASDAAPVIKAYSPDLIVHPVLDDAATVTGALEWLDRLHVVVIGPGLGRQPATFDAVTVLLDALRERKKPLVIDADGLFLLAQKPKLLYNYPAGLVLTPNAVECQRLFGGQDVLPDALKPFGPHCIVVRKGREDQIVDETKRAVCTVPGSGRRCGGQGDLLSGSLATFYGWSLMNQSMDAKLRAMAACYAACKLTRQCNADAFKVHGRSMTCSDMIQQIGAVFTKNFDTALQT